MRLTGSGSAARNPPYTRIPSTVRNPPYTLIAPAARNARYTRMVAAVLAIVLGTTAPAFADATVFIGGNTSPSSRQVKGFAFGAGLLIVAFEFEYANTSEDLEEAAPALKTFMGNVLLQTPFAIMGLQPYFTTGGGGYRESLDAVQETHIGVNTGGGVKVSLLGPLRARVDYRVFSLRGSPLHDVVNRFYVGANLKF